MGENGFGEYYLHQVKDTAGKEYSFFAPADIHQLILESGIKAGDQFKLTKTAVQNGKKVSSRIDFEVVSKAPVSSPESKKDDVLPDVPDDGFKGLMQRASKMLCRSSKK